MKVIADLHIHSRFSRATSKEISIPNLEKYAKIKGVNLLGTGDFTHPEWIKELKEKLKEDGSGILKTATGFNFVLQTEISLMYSQDNKGRRIHLIVLAPNLEIVGQINEILTRNGRLDYDGRPIFNIPCPQFVEMMKNISDDIEIIPAHVWTPWYGLFGSQSGFDSVEECFKDQTKHIFALETGLSSDPEMNWRVSALDKYSLISNSDLHSFWPWRLGRECNIFEIDNLTYKNLIKSIRTRQGFKETIEVDPSYGKYHYDGHRNCNISFSPKESLEHRDICPVCGRKLTIGVLHRVEELADRPEGFKLEKAVPFKRIIPLSEILAKLVNSGIASQKTWNEYNNLVMNLKDEFNVLLNAKKEELLKFTDERIADTIIKNRKSQIEIQPGYDGEYGYLILSEKDIKKKEKIEKKKEQKALQEFFE